MCWRKNKSKPLSTLVVAHSSIIYNRKCPQKQQHQSAACSQLALRFFPLPWSWCSKRKFSGRTAWKNLFSGGLLQMNNWTFAFIKHKRILQVGVAGINFLWCCCFVFPCGLKDRLAHHRWLLFFQFGEGDKSNVQEFKKLKFLLKDEHIQVRVLTHPMLNAIYIPRASHGFHCC